METAFTGQDQLREQGIVLHDTYRLVRQLGFGGMGVVYEGIHTRLPRRFAIKVLLRSLLANPEAHARFCREAEIMSRLRHPHIVQIFDFNVTPDNQPYFVMEYLEGRDLDTVLAGDGPMPLEKAVPIIQSTASALMAAHRHDIVHRDLKPSNIFLCDVGADADGDGDGEATRGGPAPANDNRAEPAFVKVLDFGVSKVRSSGRITLGAKITGTPRYLSPEQAAGRLEQIDGRTDQFALAAIAYEMLTGQDAFVGDDSVSLLYQIVHEDPQPLGRHVPWDARGVEQVLDCALAKDPARRFPTIVDFSNALAAAARRIADGRPSRQVLEARRDESFDSVEAPPTGAPAMLAAEVVRTEVMAPQLLPAPPAGALDASESAQPWTEREITETTPRVPLLPYRPIALAAVATALIALIFVKGWQRELPDDITVAARAIEARLIGLAGRQRPAEPMTQVREAAPPAPAPLPSEPTPENRAAASALPPGATPPGAPPGGTGDEDYPAPAR